MALDQKNKADLRDNFIYRYLQFNKYTKGAYSYEQFLELDNDFINTVESIQLSENYSQIKYQMNNIGKNKKPVQIKAELNAELRRISKLFYE